MNNKGFSLVELIIVIAIMAVLVGVLAPQFLKYVEQSRVQKDESACGEVNNATKIACSVEEVYDAIPDTGDTASYGDADGAISFSTAELNAEIAKSIPNFKAFSSKKYKGQKATTTVTINKDDSTVQVQTIIGTTTID